MSSLEPIRSAAVALWLGDSLRESYPVPAGTSPPAATGPRIDPPRRPDPKARFLTRAERCRARTRAKSQARKALARAVKAGLPRKAPVALARPLGPDHPAHSWAPTMPWGVPA